MVLWLTPVLCRYWRLYKMVTCDPPYLITRLHFYKIRTVCIYFLSVTLPKIDYEKETSKISITEGLRNPLQVKRRPIATSFAIFNEGTILVDPCEEEESLSTGIITIVVEGDELYSINKPGIVRNLPLLEN